MLSGCLRSQAPPHGLLWGSSLERGLPVHPGLRILPGARFQRSSQCVPAFHQGAAVPQVRAERRGMPAASMVWRALSPQLCGPGGGKSTGLLTVFSQRSDPVACVCPGAWSGNEAARLAAGLGALNRSGQGPSVGGVSNPPPMPTAGSRHRSQTAATHRWRDCHPAVLAPSPPAWIHTGWGDPGPDGSSGVCHCWSGCPLPGPGPVTAESEGLSLPTGLTVGTVLSTS